MAGPNLEVFKFAVYVFFPVLVFLRYGDPEWYQTNVIPVRSPFDHLKNRVVKTPSNCLSSTKNGYSLLKRGRHVVTIFQLTMPLCVKSLSVSRQKKLHGVRSVNVTRRRLREAPLRARGSKGWCSYRGSEVRPLAHRLGCLRAWCCFQTASC